MLQIAALFHSFGKTPSIQNSAINTSKDLSVSYWHHKFLSHDFVEAELHLASQFCYKHGHRSDLEI